MTGPIADGKRDAALRPLRVLLSVRPFRGHLHPLVPLARAFLAAGHHVAVATAEDAGPVVVGAGLSWYPAGLNPRQAQLVFPDDDSDYGVPAVEAKVEDLLEIAVGQYPPDVIVREPTDLAPALASEIIGALNVTYGVAHFIPVSSWEILGADVTLRDLRRHYGLADDPDLSFLYRDLYLAVLPPFLEAYHPLPVPVLQQIRYVPWDGDRRGPVPAVPAATRGGRPTVLMTLGTVYNTHTALFDCFLDAVAGEDIDVTCTLGEDGEMPAAAPDNVRFERYLPHSSILPGCDVTLCHAGFNTVMGSLVSGVPVVCVPLGSDQEYNAQACADNGFGEWLPAAEASGPSVRAALRRVLDDPSFAARAQAFGRDMKAVPGPPAAVRRVVALVEERLRSGRRDESWPRPAP